MREAALIGLLLLPKWGVFADFRSSIEDYLEPQKTVSVQKVIPPVPMGPLRVGEGAYAGNEKAIYSLDLSSDTSLIENNIDDRLQIASLTKLMTAYVALKEGKALTESVTIPVFVLEPGDAVVGLNTGEQLSYGDLIASMLINSGSDAAQSVATISGGDQTKFVAQMNLAAAGLGLTNTHFANPVGWDSLENYSSARDIANLTRVLLGNTFFRETVGSKAKVVTTKAGRQIALTSTNQLLGVNGFAGVKTGYTYGALECLTSLERVADHEILTVVLGSGNRFGETTAANTWTKQHFLW